MARLTLKLLKIEPPFVVAIDRTEWQLGKVWVNVLMLSVGYKNISLPLFWTVLEEKGCSDNAERSTIVQRVINEFWAECIRFVTADREFASKQWLAFLVRNKIGFRLRIKANTLITGKCGRSLNASKMLKTMKKGGRSFRESASCGNNQSLWQSAVKRMATMWLSFHRREAGKSCSNMVRDGR